MKFYICFFHSLFLLTCPILYAQDDSAIQGRDFEYFTETEEAGTNYKVVSFYLKNTSESKILFFNFQVDGYIEDMTFIKKLPADIMILDPRRANKFCTIKLTDKLPKITWNARILYPSVGFNKFPENGKQYVFYWESEVKQGQTAYSYFLKNICDRRMKFQNFQLAETGAQVSFQKIPASTVYLWPDSTVKVAEISIPDNTKAPELTWFTVFTAFQPTGDEFCNHFIKILEASGEGDFGSVKGNQIDKNTYTCTIGLPGVILSTIKMQNNQWQFTGQAGENGLKKDIENRFKQYADKIDQCIPDVIALSIQKNKSTANKSAIFTGTVDNKKYTVYLEVEGSTALPENYHLTLSILSAE